MSASYRVRRDQIVDLVERVPILGRLVTDFARIEFIDRCMLIAAQGLLALVPMLVVLAAFLPDLTGQAVHSFGDAVGVGPGGTTLIEGQVSDQQVRTHTGIVGLVITILSATSFARAVQRMYERIWEQPHVGGISGARRCLLWLIGWLMTIQLIAGLRTLLGAIGGVLGSGIGLGVQCATFALLWWATSWALLFGRVPWRHLLLGAALTGVLGVAYNRGSGLVMPPYVEANAEQFGTLGIILAISTWLIGFAAIMVASALVGRVVSEDPTVRRVVNSVVMTARPLLPRRWRGADPADGTAAPAAGG
jgi:membrane protein